MSNTDIASALFLTEGTVRNYVSSIFSKLNVLDRTQAAVIALRNGLADGHFSEVAEWSMRS
jgi:DNA-binding NarL/FixJ family response regulator